MLCCVRVSCVCCLSWWIFADGLFLMRTISIIFSHNWHVWARKILHLCGFDVLCTCIFHIIPSEVERWRWQRAGKSAREWAGGRLRAWMCKGSSERVRKNYMLSWFDSIRLSHSAATLVALLSIYIRIDTHTYYIHILDFLFTKLRKRAINSHHFLSYCVSVWLWMLWAV